MEPLKDQSTANPDGTYKAPRIDGLVIRPAVHLTDRRGELVEVYRSDWEIHPDPLVQVYQVMVLPGSGRGWTIHRYQDDRLYHCMGMIHWAFYDDRPASPTYQMLNKITFGDHNRSLFIIPRGVYHACKNIGHENALFFNMPTRQYDHDDPDKYRLPLKNDVIPYDFSDCDTW